MNSIIFFLDILCHEGQFALQVTSVFFFLLHISYIQLQNSLMWMVYYSKLDTLVAFLFLIKKDMCVLNLQTAEFWSLFSVTALYSFIIGRILYILLVVIYHFVCRIRVKVCMWYVDMIFWYVSCGFLDSNVNNFHLTLRVPVT